MILGPIPVSKQHHTTGTHSYGGTDDDPGDDQHWRRRFLPPVINGTGQWGSVMSCAWSTACSDHGCPNLDTSDFQYLQDAHAFGGFIPSGHYTDDIATIKAHLAINDAEPIIDEVKASQILVAFLVVENRTSHAPITTLLTLPTVLLLLPC